MLALFLLLEAEDTLDQSFSENIPSSPSSGSRGMLSAITNAVQNTVSRFSWPLCSSYSSPFFDATSL